MIDWSVDTVGKTIKKFLRKYWKLNHKENLKAWKICLMLYYNFPSHQKSSKKCSAVFTPRNGRRWRTLILLIIANTFRSNPKVCELKLIETLHATVYIVIRQQLIILSTKFSHNKNRWIFEATQNDFIRNFPRLSHNFLCFILECHCRTINLKNVVWTSKQMVTKIFIQVKGFLQLINPASDEFCGWALTLSVWEMKLSLKICLAEGPRLNLRENQLSSFPSSSDAVSHSFLFSCFGAEIYSLVVVSHTDDCDIKSHTQHRMQENAFMTRQSLLFAKWFYSGTIQHQALCEDSMSGVSVTREILAFQF